MGANPGSREERRPWNIETTVPQFRQLDDVRSCSSLRKRRIAERLGYLENSCVFFFVGAKFDDTTVPESLEIGAFRFRLETYVHRDPCCCTTQALLDCGVGIDGGKDSLSMAARCGDELVKSPGTLVMTVSLSHGPPAR